jgi:type II secretory ATPase GspE/PulE/Tfp pilus assembly ATPase PilB-like protein
LAQGKKRKKLGEVLRAKGQITEEAVATAISQQSDSIHLGEPLLQRGIVSRANLAQALVEITHVPGVDLSTVARDPECIKLIPRSTAERCCAIALVIEDHRLEIAMAHPQDLQLLHELRFTCEMEISPRFAFRSEILKAIEDWYSSYSDAPVPTGDEQQEQTDASDEVNPNEPQEEMEFISASSSRRNTEAVKEMQEELTKKGSAAVRLVSKLVAAAMKRQASDIHIEPRENDTIVRLRVDGILRDFTRVPPKHQYSLVSRITILADMDIAERR